MTFSCWAGEVFCAVCDCGAEVGGLVEGIGGIGTRGADGVNVGGCGGRGTGIEATLGAGVGVAVGVTIWFTSRGPEVCVGTFESDGLNCV